MNDHLRLRLAAALLLGTVLVLVLDLSSSVVPQRMRQLAATVIGPAQRLVVGHLDERIVALDKENAQLRARLALADEQARSQGSANRLLDEHGKAHRLLGARVLGTATTAMGGRVLTIDVGSRDGVEPNVTVVGTGGLVGRTISVAPWSSDVAVFGGDGASIGVRVGKDGLLCALSGQTSAALPSRAPGQLTLTCPSGQIGVGDQVSSLGSIGGRPYIGGLTVGTVAALDPPSGQPSATAVVDAAVDPDHLDVVAVLPDPLPTDPRQPVGAP